MYLFYMEFAHLKYIIDTIPNFVGIFSNVLIIRVIAAVKTKLLVSNFSIINRTYEYIYGMSHRDMFINKYSSN